MDAHFDWSIAFFLIGVSFFLILIDVFFIPTAIVSTFSVIAFLSYVLYVWQSQSFIIAGILFLIYMAVVVTFLLVVRQFKLWQWFQLRIQAEKGDAAGNKLEKLMDTPVNNNETALASTDLRPSGSVQVGEWRYDALSCDGFFIKKGEKVYIHGRSVGQLLVSVLPKAENTEGDREEKKR